VQHDVFAVARGGNRRILHPRHRTQGTLDLHQLDPLAAHLHLSVTAAHERDQPVGALADEIAGKKDPL